jgi:hypothetical protein
VERHRALDVCQPCIGVCRAHADMCSGMGEAVGAWRRVDDWTNPILLEISRSVDEDCCGGATFSNRSSETPDLGFERCGSMGRMNIVVGTFSGTWRRVISPMEVFPP